jgi:hypothetical protein
MINDIYCRPLVENLLMQKETAFRYSNVLISKLHSNIGDLAIIYDNKVSPPTYGDYIIVLAFARYFVAQGVNVSFFIINGEYRDDWRHLDEKDKIEHFVGEQYKLASILLDNKKAKTLLVTWDEFQKKYACSFGVDQIIPHGNKVLSRQPIYNYCFNLMSYLLSSSHPEVQSNTLFNNTELSKIKDKKITGKYITWHCRYSTQWGHDRNLSEIDFIKISNFLESRFLGYYIMIVSDDIGCNYFSKIARKHNIDLLYSKDYSSTFLGDCALLYDSKFYFAFNGGGISVFPIFSLMPYLIITGSVHEVYWKPGKYVQWQTQQQAHIKDTDFNIEYLKIIDVIITNGIKKIR